MSGTKLLGIYSNGMVLQRNKEIIIEGSEDLKSEVKVTLAEISVTAEVIDGRFKAVLPPADVIFDTELKVEGTDNITIKDVCVGDVYLLSGQSNMQLPVCRTVDLNKEEIEARDYPFVRQYTLDPDLEIPLIGEDSICQLPETDWIKAVGEDKNPFSAVGFYAAKRIFEEKNIPVGLILTAQGGSNVESWMCEEDLYETGISEDMIAPFRGKGVLKAYVEDGAQRTNAWRESTIDKDFSIESAAEKAETVTLPAIVLNHFSGSAWFIKEFELDSAIEGTCLLRLGDLIDADITYINGVEVGRTEYQYPPRKYYFDGSILKTGKNVIATRLIIENDAGGFVPGHPYVLETPSGNIGLTGEWKMVIEKKQDRFVPNQMAQMIPTALYYASTLTLKNIAISQIWWYQGESNAGEPEGYDKKMILAFKKMREIFGEVPLVMIKIADYINPLTFQTEVPEGWRTVQRLQDEAPGYISNTKVVEAPCPDPVYELHPQNKSILGADVAKCAIEFG